MSKENEEDVSGIDDIFDDNKDNIDKFPKTGETPVTDSDTMVDQEENEMEEDKIRKTMEQREKMSGKMKRQEEWRSPNP